eukprot:TRINITY_DN62536_c0_g1_i1.p1 TRINITY_DN62536_c0_g1~~TRINITY_DN62536_c0_g1_i1.p1  ORF type:complete len:444 (+),score=49.54 TRINITY_DN62536_c0_g1_i1:178-1509(+)
MTFSFGVVAAAGAAVAFGVQYVPVKHYAIYDGTTFQLFMCSGMLSVAIVTAAVTNNLQNGFAPQIVLGGVLWALSNFAALFLVNLLGIGAGFSLFHCVNSMVGYVTGRVGFFGMPTAVEVFPGSLRVSGFGFILILVSFILFVFVESRSNDQKTRCFTAVLAKSSGEMYMELYYQWRQGVADSCTNMCDILDTTSLGQYALTGNSTFSSGGFSMHGSITEASSDADLKLREHPQQAASLIRQPLLHSEACSSSYASLRERNRLELDLFVASAVAGAGLQRYQALIAQYKGLISGVLLTAVSGTCASLQAVPASLDVVRKSSSSVAVFLPHSLGIWMGSCTIYLIYSSFAALKGWPVPHSVIRPAFVSGMTWAIGFLLTMIGINNFGYAVGYTLVAVGPVWVSSVLSIFVYKELTSRRQLVLYASAQVLQSIGTVLIVGFGGNT